MNETVINGMFVLAGTFIGAVSSVIISVYSIKQTKINKKRLKNYKMICDDVIAYQKLEKMLNQEILNLRLANGQNQAKPESVRREFRRKLKNDGLQINFSPSKVERLQNNLKNDLSDLD